MTSRVCIVHSTEVTCLLTITYNVFVFRLRIDYCQVRCICTNVKPGGSIPSLEQTPGRSEMRMSQKDDVLVRSRGSVTRPCIRCRLNNGIGSGPFGPTAWVSRVRTITLLYSTLLYSTLLYSTLLYSTLLYSTLLYSTLLYSTLLSSPLLSSPLLYSTLLYSTLLYSTLLYSTLLYSTPPYHTP